MPEAPKSLQSKNVSQCFYGVTWNICLLRGLNEITWPSTVIRSTFQKTVCSSPEGKINLPSPTGLPFTNMPTWPVPPKKPFFLNRLAQYFTIRLRKSVHFQKKLAEQLSQTLLSELHFSVRAETSHTA